MKICYRGHFTGISGYSRATRAHARALIEAGVEIEIQDNKKDAVVCTLDPFWRKELPPRLVSNYNKADVIIWHETPEFYAPAAGKRNIAYLAWETSKIPSVDLGNNPNHNWVSQLNRMSEVWVPCYQNRHALLESGVTVPLIVVPHPIRIEDYKLDTPPLYERDPNFDVQASTVFQWQPRKDPVTLLLGLYLSSSKTRLLLKTYVSDPKHGAADILKRIKSVRNSFHVPPTSVTVPIFDQLSDEQMPALYASSDVYITTSRGEGFCLPAVEAMAMGKPIIAPLTTAFADFLFPLNNMARNGIQIPGEYTPVIGMDWIPWYSPDQEWFQSNPTALKRIIDSLPGMLQSGQLGDMGIQARKTVEMLFNSDKIGALMKQTLGL